MVARAPLPSRLSNATLPLERMGREVQVIDIQTQVYLRSLTRDVDALLAEARRVRESFALDGDQVSSSTTQADVRDFTLDEIPAGQYVVRLHGVWTASVNTEALRLAINVSGSLASLALWQQAFSTAAGANEVRKSTTNNAGPAMVVGPTGDQQVLMNAFFVTETAGSFAIRMAAETGGANSVTLRDGTVADLVQL